MHKRDYRQDQIRFLKEIQTRPSGLIDTDFNENCSDRLNNQLETTKLLVLGETHGVLENTDIIYTLCKKFNFKKLALEWNEDLLGLVDEFLKNQDDDIDFSAIHESPDGRITSGHFSLIRKLNTEGLLSSVLCFDTSHTTDWNERDAAMSKNILNHLTNERMIVITGRLHAKTAPFKLKGKDVKYRPLGANIKREIPELPTVEINYLSGRYHNLGIKQFEEQNGTKGKKVKFYDLDEYRYVYELPEAHPAIVPNPSEVVEL